MTYKALARQHLFIALSSIVLIFTTATCVAGETPAPKITVTGQGSVSVAPDMAVVTMTVAREAE